MEENNLQKENQTTSQITKRNSNLVQNNKALQSICISAKEVPSKSWHYNEAKKHILSHNSFFNKRW